MFIYLEVTMCDRNEGIRAHISTRAMVRWRVSVRVRDAIVRYGRGQGHRARRRTLGPRAKRRCLLPGMHHIH